MPSVRPRFFDGRCVGLGVLAAGTVVALALMLGSAFGTSAGTGLVVGLLFVSVSAQFGLFPPWRDEKHGTAAGGLVLALGGVLMVCVGVWLRGALQ